MTSQIATFATIFFSMILVNNYVLVQFLGICQIGRASCRERV